LERLYLQYVAGGFAVLGFPRNQSGRQEPEGDVTWNFEKLSPRS
jgi:glutathione peroxidase-family protein